MSRMEEAISRLERIAERPICSTRKEELREVIALLREEMDQECQANNAPIPGTS